MKTRVDILTLLIVLAVAAPAWAQDAGHMRDIENARNDLDEAKQKLDKELGLDKPPANDLERSLREAFGVEKAQKELDAIELAAMKVKTTDEDFAGFDALCRMKWDEAEAQFKKSLTASPGRPFPQYFLGVAAFDRADYAAAKEAFAKTLALDPSVRSAHLLRRLAELCEGEGDRGFPAEKLLMFHAQACRETEKALKLKKDESFGSWLFPQLTSDPVLYKALEFLRTVAKRRATTIAEDARQPREPDVEFIRALAFAPRKETAAAAMFMAAKFPAEKPIQVFAFLDRYFGPQEEKPFPPPEGFAADLDKALALEEGNGALMLLKIPYRRAAKLGDPEPLLTGEDVAVVNAAARAPQFCTYTHWVVHQTREVRTRYFGGYAPRMELSVFGTPNLYPMMLGLARRAGTTFGEYLAAGKRDAAMELFRDMQRLADRMVEDSPLLLSRLVSDSVSTAMCTRALRSLAAADPGPEAAGEIAARFEEVVLRKQTNKVVAGKMNIEVIFALPVRRLAEAYEAAVETDRAPLDAAFAEEVARWRESLCADAIERLGWTLERGGGVAPLPSNTYTSIALLGALKDPKAIASLEKLAAFKDPAAKLLATRALAKIRQ